MKHILPHIFFYILISPLCIGQVSINETIIDPEAKGNIKSIIGFTLKVEGETVSDTIEIKKIYLSNNLVDSSEWVYKWEGGFHNNCIYIYNKNDKIIEKKYLNDKTETERIEYFYNKKKLSEIKYYSTRANTSGPYMTQKYEHYRDSVIIYGLNSSDSVYGYITRYYDNNILIKESFTIDGNKTVKHFNKHEDIKTETHFNKNMDTISNTVFIRKYENDLLVSLSMGWSTNDATLVSEIEYVFDSHGNWTEEKSKKREDNYILRKRIITYDN